MAIPEKGSRPPGSPDASRRDAELVDACLARTPGSWETLVQRYQRLVYSIIHNSGAARREESDVFQAVWFDVFNELSRLCNRDSAKAWISTVTRHKCYHWRLKKRRLPDELDNDWVALLPDQGDLPPEIIEDIERGTEIRAAIDSLPYKCRCLLTALFLVDPPRPYKEIAKSLGMATGSIGAQRARCLQRLKAALTRRGIDAS
ncbi:MAG: sigma-70 family RNA polymerase sigma factor [Acidobacteriota bacterium]|nr:sigma-70 family RNA polymerase sigma factor [Acidobacteriota bacterium]